MIQPGVYNITLQRRSDYSVLLDFKDANKAPIDLTGWTVAAQVWNQARSTKYADFSVEYVSRATGRVRLRLSRAATEGFPSESVYDVLLVNNIGEHEYYLEGSIYTAESYTSVP